MKRKFKENKLPARGNPLLNTVFKRAFEHLKVNKWLSVATVMVLVLSFTISGIVLFIVLGLNSSVNEFASRPRIYVYFHPQTEEEKIFEIKEMIEKKSTVESVEYNSQEDALEDLKEKLGTSSSTPINNLASLLPSRLSIKPKNLNDVETLVAEISEDLDGNLFVDEIRYSQDAIVNLRAMSKVVTVNGFALVAIAVVVTMIIIYVSINFGVKYYLEELKIMDFLGSSQAIQTLPFVVEACVYGVIGGLFAGINLGIFKYGNLYMINKDPNLNSFVSNSSFSSLNTMPGIVEIFKDFGLFILAMVGVGVVLCAISSGIAVSQNMKLLRKH